MLSAEGLGEGLKIVSADRRRQSHPKRCGSSPRLSLSITTEHQTHHLWGSATSVELRRWMGSASQLYRAGCGRKRCIYAIRQVRPFLFRISKGAVYAVRCLDSWQRVDHSCYKTVVMSRNSSAQHLKTRIVLHAHTRSRIIFVLLEAYPLWPTTNLVRRLTTPTPTSYTDTTHLRSLQLSLLFSLLSQPSFTSSSSSRRGHGISYRWSSEACVRSIK